MSASNGDSSVFLSPRMLNLEQRLAEAEQRAHQVLDNGEQQVDRLKKVDPTKTKLEFRPPSTEEELLTPEEETEMAKLRAEYETGTGRFLRAHINGANGTYKNGTHARLP